MPSCLLDRCHGLSACSLSRTILGFYRGLFHLFWFYLIFIWLPVIFLLSSFSVSVCLFLCLSLCLTCFCFCFVLVCLLCLVCFVSFASLPLCFFVLWWFVFEFWSCCNMWINPCFGAPRWLCGCVTCIPLVSHLFRSVHHLRNCFVFSLLVSVYLLLVCFSFLVLFIWLVLFLFVTASSTLSFVFLFLYCLFNLFCFCCYRFVHPLICSFSLVLFI